jgi:hypothetical protein
MSMKNKGIRFLGSMLLMGTLAVPLALGAQDRDDRKDHDRDDQSRNQRVYDRDHKDYHQWNGDEDRNYRQWYESRYHGKQYRDYNRLNKRDQNAYWKWRHQRGDRDDNRGDQRRDDKH